MGITNNIFLDTLYKFSDLDSKDPMIKELYKMKSKLSLEELRKYHNGLSAIKIDKSIDLRTVQQVGALYMCKGNFIEMKTGEGKTLTAVLSAIISSVHGQTIIVTSNDYLANRDYLDSKTIFDMSGLKSCYIPPREQYEGLMSRKEMYDSDVIYTTSSTLIFDYLNNSLVKSVDNYIEFKFNNIIVDEADYVLLDSGCIPHILSGDDTVSNLPLMEKVYRKVDMLRPSIHYKIINSKDVVLTGAGLKVFGKLLNRNHALDSDVNRKVYRLIVDSIDVKLNFTKNKHYVVEDGKVILIDNDLGRKKMSSRLSGGKHQLLEIKEGVKVLSEANTATQITVQAYYKLYKQLSGMSGTLISSREEIKDIYDSEVVPILTYRPIKRTRDSDVVVTTLEGKYNYIIDEIKQSHNLGYPILVIMGSDREAELISKRLKKNKLRHNVVTNVTPEEEAEVIKGAGSSGNITVSTVMLGRGTDIKLLDDRAKEAGLRVICGERFNTSRVDEQILGRAGRQGDNGSVVFYCSLEDERFKEPLKTLKSRLGKLDVDKISNMKLASVMINNIQSKYTQSMSDSRKSMSEYELPIDNYRKEYFDLRYSLLSKRLDLKSLSKLIDNTLGYLFKNEKDVKSLVSVLSLKGIESVFLMEYNPFKLLNKEIYRDVSQEFRLLSNNINYLDDTTLDLLLSETDKYFSKLFVISETLRECGLSSDESSKVTYFKEIESKIDLIRFNINASVLGYLASM